MPAENNEVFVFFWFCLPEAQFFVAESPQLLHATNVLLWNVSMLAF